MKYLTFIFFIVFTVISVNAQKTNPNYNAELAKKVGADDYGMKKFVFVILKTGTNTSKNNAFKKECFASHMKSIDKLVKAKKLLVAGPMVKNDNNYRGIFILAVSSKEKAKELLGKDKAISENFLEAVYYDWYGSAALGEYLNSADKVWKKSY